MTYQEFMKRNTLGLKPPCDRSDNQAEGRGWRSHMMDHRVNHGPKAVVRGHVIQGLTL